MEAENTRNMAAKKNVAPNIVLVNAKEATITNGPILQVVPREEWVTLTKTGNDRGKGNKKITTPEWLKCANGFDALGVSKDIIALDDPGTC